MTIRLPNVISDGDTTDPNKIRENFEYLEKKLNESELNIASLADTDASNSSLYFSTTSSKLVWKDAGGTVHNLY